MFKVMRWAVLLVAILALLLYQPTTAQFPPGLLPVTVETFNDSVALKLAIIRFQADSSKLARLYSEGPDTTAMWLNADPSAGEGSTTNHIGFYIFPYKGGGEWLAAADSEFVTKFHIDSIATWINGRIDSEILRLDSLALASVAEDSTQNIEIEENDNNIHDILTGVVYMEISIAASGGLNLTVEADTGGPFVVVLLAAHTVIQDTVIALTANAVNYIYCDTSGTVKANTTGFPPGAMEQFNIPLEVVETDADTLLWLNRKYEVKERLVVNVIEYLEFSGHHVVESGFEVSAGTSANDQFDFGDGGTENSFHSIHGWQNTLIDSADFYFTDDVIGTIIQAFDVSTYGDEVAFSGNGYYSKFIIWVVGRYDNNDPIFHLTRSLSEYPDVGEANASPFPQIPEAYHDVGIPLIGIVYKKNKDWSDLSVTKDWMVTSFLSSGSVPIGGTGGGIDAATAELIAAGAVNDTMVVFRLKGVIDTVLSDSINTRALAVTGNFTVASGSVVPRSTVTIGQVVGDYIQDTLDAVLDSALSDVVNGGMIFIQGGTYQISDGDTIKLADPDTVSGNIFVVGEPGKTIIEIDGVENQPRFHSLAGRLLRNTEFQDIGFVDVSGLADGIGFTFLKADITLCDSIVFRRCTFKNFTDLEFSGVNALAWKFIDCKVVDADNVTFGGGNATGWLIRDCEFYGDAAISGNFINLVWAQSRFLNNKVVHTSTVGGLVIGARHHNVYDGNEITSPDSANYVGISASSDESIYRNNTIGNPVLGKVMMRNGIDLTGGGTGNIVMGNKIYGARVDGIEINDNNNSVSGNHLFSCGTGIDFAGGDKSGHTENWFLSVTTNVATGGSTNTVAGDIRDLD